jgi:hypothetical protein
VLSERRLSDDQRVVTWRLGGHPEDPSSGLYGVSVVEGQTRLYTHRAERGAVDVRFETGDFSADGRLDVLAITDNGHGCLTYRALVAGPGRATPVATRSFCSDNGSMHLTPSGLVVREGRKRTVVRWNGRRLVLRR